MENEPIRQREMMKYSRSIQLAYGLNVSIDTIVDKFRRYVMVLLTIRIILLVLYFGFKMFHLVQYAGYSTIIRHNSVTAAISIRLIFTSLGIIFFILFFIFVIRYESFGTQICTWLTIFDLAINVTSLIFTLNPPMNSNIIASTTLTIIITIILVLSILSIILLIVVGFQYTNSIEIQSEYQRI